MSFSIPFRAAAEGQLQASKWQKIPVLLDEKEMEGLVASLGQFWIVRTSGLVSGGEEVIPSSNFLEVYNRYLEAIKKGEEPQDPRTRPYFSSAWTVSPDPFYAVKVNEKQSLIKVERPVIQLQAHRFDYSLADATFRSMVFGMDSIPWGIQFSYPHLFQDKNLQVLTVREGPQFPNTALFKEVQQWIRSNTIATPFEIEGKKINVPIRLGKKCLEWASLLPQLQSKRLRIV